MNDIKAWLKAKGWDKYSIEIASSDASFRSYYRLFRDEKSYILMDSSLQKESLVPFLDMQNRLFAVGVKVPEVLERNLEMGFLILEDFGSTHLLELVNLPNSEDLYLKAIDEIIKMQKANCDNLPQYDGDFLRFEMDLMNEWYIRKYLSIELDKEKLDKLNAVLEFITNEVLAQVGGVSVHRDFHSRNIMITKDSSIGVIDFQDARSGACTYDLVSLLKDCYYELDGIQREKYALYFKSKANLGINDETFMRWFDMMGLQRHIKVLGIFARLSIRDGKDGYLADIPLTLKYVLETANKYEQTKPLLEILK